MSALEDVTEFIGETLAKRFEIIDANTVEGGFYVPLYGSGLRIDVSALTDEHLIEFAEEMDIPAEVRVVLNFFICKGIERSEEFFEFCAIDMPALTDYMPWVYEEDDAETLGVGLFCALPGESLNEYQFLLTVEGLLKDGFKVASALIENFDAEWMFEVSEDDD